MLLFQVSVNAIRLPTRTPVVRFWVMKNFFEEPLRGCVNLMFSLSSLSVEIAVGEVGTPFSLSFVVTTARSTGERLSLGERGSTGSGTLCDWGVCTFV